MLVGFALLAALSCCRGYEIVPADPKEGRCPGRVILLVLITTTR